jgi:starvation-inducible DNA-binding protein
MDMKPNFEVADKNRQSVVMELSKILADEFLLYTKTKNAHWNIEGEDFYEKHTFFESQFQQVESFVDSVAERIRSLGHYTPSTLQSFLKLSHLTEMTRKKNDSLGYIKELLADHESIIKKLQENTVRIEKDLHHSGTSEFIANLIESHEKMAWHLRSHI